jgi:hypothetical protein
VGISRSSGTRRPITLQPVQGNRLRPPENSLIAYTGSEYSKEMRQTRGYDVLIKHPDSERINPSLKPIAIMKSPDKKEDQYYKKNIHFDEKKAAAFDLRNVKLLIIDSGLDVQHPEFQGININVPETSDFEREEYIMERNGVTNTRTAEEKIYQNIITERRLAAWFVETLTVLHVASNWWSIMSPNYQDALTRTRFVKKRSFMPVCANRISF